MKKVISQSNQLSAFTLTDLVVMIATIGLLIALVLPSLAAAREKSPRTQCMGNLRQLWLATQIYANENNDLPPQGDLAQHSTGSPVDCHAGSAIWDIPNGSATKLVNSGAKRSAFYCPTASIINDNFWWFYNNPAPTSTRLGDYATQSYLWMFNRGDTFISHANRPTYPDNTPANGNSTNPRQLIKKLTGANTNLTLATTELIADATVSEGNNRNTAKYVGVASVNSGMVLGGVVFRGFNSSHLQNNVPAGGNILFLDGHAAWRSFPQMDWIVAYSSGRYFWF